jgi:acid phosphatase
MRHGERYPTKGTGKGNKQVFEKLKNATIENYEGPLAFVKDWEFYIPDSSRLETESDMGVYAGLADCYSVGVQHRERYNHLFDGKTVHPLFASGQERVVESARAFGKGFFASNYTDLCSVQIIPEKATQGANSLTTHDACVNYNSSIGDAISNEFSDDYLKRAAARLNKLSPGYNITGDDVYNLMGYCGFELNVKGHSHACGLFTLDEWVSFDYSKSLTFYYENSYGYNLSTPLGYVTANNTYTLMSQEFPYNLTFSFSHDSDLLTFITALGLFEPESDLSTDEIEFGSVFKASEIIPMGGRMVHEVLECEDVLTNKTETFVRVIVNEAVTPIPACQDGPGYSCPLDSYKEVIDARLGNTSYIAACGVNSTAPQYTTFYWDWDATFKNNFVTQG